MTTVEEFRRKSWRQLNQVGVPRMSDEQLRRFVVDFMGGRIFTSAQIRNDGDIPMVFMPLALGALHDWPREDWADIGIFYEYLDKAGPRSINGNPCFFSFRLMHVEDWKRCHVAIVREQERQQEIEV
jgi:hypothetical protein